MLNDLPLHILLMAAEPEGIYGYGAQRRLEGLAKVFRISGCENVPLNRIYRVLNDLESCRHVEMTRRSSDGKGPGQCAFMITERGREYLSTRMKVIAEVTPKAILAKGMGRGTV
jgi:DNA-binding PadR family transcriptional regulator